MNKLIYKNTKKELLINLIKTYEAVCLNLETKIDKYNRLLSMGQETGSGPFKYDIEGEERQEISNEIENCVRSINYYDEQIYIISKVLEG